LTDEFPGVFIEEIPSGDRQIEGVSTSITGFIGQALKGPINEPMRVVSFAEYERLFGGLWSEGPMSYAIQDYFNNGGQNAVVVRLEKKKTCLINSKWPFFHRATNENIGFHEIANPDLVVKKHGLWAFDKIEPINLLCIPPFAPQVDVDNSTWQAALNYCRDRRAFLVVDPPSTWKTVEDVSLGIEGMNLRDGNAAFYFPYLEIEDPLNRRQNNNFAPCGAVAGIIARTDRSRGVWKAPAGVDALLFNDPKPATSLTTIEIGELSQLGVNSFHEIPNTGLAIWGARTLMGDDQHTSEWKYIPVRRTTLFIEESLSQGLKWVVFEPNNEPLWAQIRMCIEDFLIELFRQGAFAGSTPTDAYFVKCDRETMTQSDIDNGIVNLLVGFAPLKPAEFIIIKLQLNANRGS